MSRTFVEPEIIESEVGSGRWQVVMFDNDHTPIEEVIKIVMSSTGCGLEEATTEVWETQTYGKAPVHFSDRSECEIVAVMISSIGVKTEVSREWKD
jgi:ribosomal protein L7/L12